MLDAAVVKKVEKEIVAWLKLEGYYSAKEAKVTKDEVLAKYFELKIVEPRLGYIAGYDAMRKKYFLSTLIGTINDGWFFEFKSEYFGTKKEALAAIKLK